jgi:hypothetical protein
MLRAELDHLRIHWTTVRLHAGVGYVTPNDEHSGRGEQIRKDREPAWNEPGRPGLPTTGRPGNMINSNTPKDPTMLSNTTRSVISETAQLTLAIWQTGARSVVGLLSIHVADRRRGRPV